MVVRAYPADLGRALRVSAVAHMDQPALWSNGHRLTYGEMFDRAARIAQSLRDNGVKAGERVGILATKSPTAYTGVLAALLAGCTYVPMNALFRPERNGVILRASGAAAVIVNDACAARIDDFIDRIGDELVVVLPDPDTARIQGGRVQVRTEDLPRTDLRSLDLGDDIDPDQAAVILFTSGTTGIPKGVPISHANISAYMGGVSRVVQITPQDRCLQLVGLTFDLSVHDMFLTWLNGAELYTLADNAGPLMTRMIRQQSITSCFVVPSPVARSIQQGLVKPDSMPSLRATFIAGEALPYPVAKAWTDAAPNTALFNLYGPTEATVSVTWHRFDPQGDEGFTTVPIGLPFGEERAELFDPDLNRVAAGQPGQILLSGDQVAAGYWQAPQLDADKYVQIDGRRWYKTGDLGRRVEPQGLIFSGRADRQVKLRSFLVELQEVEGVVRRVSGRQEVAVVAWPMLAENSYDGCVAFIVGDAMDAEALRSGCRAEVADYMAPDRFVFVDSLPANANGKVDYNLLTQHPALIQA